MATNFGQNWQNDHSFEKELEYRNMDKQAVSYTHLTLPTILRV